MIDSVKTAFLLLQTIASSPDCGLSEIARLSNINKSRVYRMLSDLTVLGYLQQNPETLTYRLGLQSVMLGQAAQGQNDLIALAEAECVKLTRKFDENVQLRVRDGTEGIQIFSRKSRQELQVHSQVGNRRKLGLGASGKLLLAYAPEPIIENCLPNLPYQIEVLMAIREAGYAESFSELTEGVCAIAAPIFSADGSCNSALSVSLPTVRATKDRIEEIRKDLLAATERISLCCGFTNSKESL
ncbi:hypothetical protein QV08_06475 [Gallibacterium salpingitidis]|uniref:HTH-type transcriptional repressor AllR n=1 Tax=Gallibacterium salpingitidis TaxID=505341 RepID=A0AB36E088_9PAST|nr:IclR family transcriptional regulator [Gallibacterium salpingitidis]OBX07655.1 hypothetical protein QV09_10455 [Gallibacterium salpingitidis]OBX07870.1 hypothetical protein QV08_06475 [Gallibacterium salpingitidis]WKT00802.1 IclR family transcriptional regulator [Gallibacterium salpingitidis]